MKPWTIQTLRIKTVFALVVLALSPTFYLLSGKGKSSPPVGASPFIYGFSYSSYANFALNFPLASTAKLSSTFKDKCSVSSDLNNTGKYGLCNVVNNSSISTNFQDGTTYFIQVQVKGKANSPWANNNYTYFKSIQVVDYYGVVSNTSTGTLFCELSNISIPLDVPYYVVIDVYEICCEQRRLVWHGTRDFEQILPSYWDPLDPSTHISTLPINMSPQLVLQMDNIVYDYKYKTKHLKCDGL